MLWGVDRISGRIAIGNAAASPSGSRTTGYSASSGRGGKQRETHRNMGSDRRTEAETAEPRGRWSASDAEDEERARRQPPPDEGPFRRFFRKLEMLFQIHPRGPFGH